jgi:hypothetical protein
MPRKITKHNPYKKPHNWNRETNPSERSACASCTRYVQHAMYNCHNKGKGVKIVCDDYLRD